MSKVEIEELSLSLNTFASAANIARFDVYGTSMEDCSVQVNGGIPQQMKSSRRTALTVRVWNAEGRSGVASSNDLGPDGLKRSLEMALDSATFGSDPNTNQMGSLAKSPLGTNLTSNQESMPPTIQKMLADLLKCESDVLKMEPKIVSIPYNGISYRNGERFYFNSEGALRWQPQTVYSCYLYSRTHEEGKKPRSAGVQKVAACYENLDLPELNSKLVKLTRTFLDYKQVSSGQKLVAFSADAFLSLLSAFSNIFNAQDVLDKRSLSTLDALETAIASPMISISDEPVHESCVSQSHFDSEGTPTATTILIKNGHLKSFLHSTYTAQKMNQKCTGNGVMGAKVRVSPHFWVVDRGTDPSVERTLEEQPEIVWIEDLHSLHAGVNETQGSFSLPFSGWIIENGQKTSIESATVAGDFRTLLKAICYVEKEKEHTPDGVCPRIWVEGLSITSESEPS